MLANLVPMTTRKAIRALWKRSYSQRKIARTPSNPSP